jgi:hypothetical protein
MIKPQVDAPLNMRRVAQTWWPLAAGWFLMTIELPAFSAVIARNDEPQVNLASWGLVFSLALIMGSPVMMLLGAATTLCRDWAAYRNVRRYMWGLSALLTVVHVLLAFTPLFDLVVVRWLNAPAEIVEHCRSGLRIMLPYVISLAVRRLNYGILIRANRARAVTLGAAVRLAADAITIAVLLLMGVTTGVIIATITITVGVMVEAIYSQIRVTPVLPELRLAPATGSPLTIFSFFRFYLPLLITSLLMILVQPMGAAALGRMPHPLESLAVWPVVFGFVILWSSAGTAFTEAVVVLLDQPKSVAVLHTFTVRMVTVMIGLLLLMNATPFAALWLEHIAALPSALKVEANWALWVAFILPGLAFIQSWHTGILMNERNTRAITEAVLIALVSNGLVLWAGLAYGNIPGIYVAIVGLVTGHLLRTAWLWVRTRTTMRQRRLRERVAALEPAGC